MPRRCCGGRIAGGVYWEHGVMSGARSEQMPYLLDPPVPIDLSALGVTAVGVKVIEHNGVTHVIDWVGERNYANVADFIEEAKAMGISRRIPRTFPFERLTAESRLFLVHRRAWIDNARLYRPVVSERLEFAGVEQIGSGIPRPQSEFYHCPDPSRRATHAAGGPQMCAGLYWEDLTGGRTVIGGSDVREVRRVMPWGRYSGRRRPLGIEPEYRSAIFGKVRLDNLAIVIDAMTDQHMRVYEQIEPRTRGRIPVHLVEE